MTNYFGTPVIDERGVIVGHEGGIMQTSQYSETLPTAVIMRNIANCDYTNQYDPSDYMAIHNLTVWCWATEKTESFVKQLLGDYEATHGPHVENHWVPVFVNALGWPW